MLAPYGLLHKKTYSAIALRFLFVGLRSSVLRVMHDDPTAGYLGTARTLYRTQECFYWTRMRETIEKYVASCAECQSHKCPTGAASPCGASKNSL